MNKFLIFLTASLWTWVLASSAHASPEKGPQFATTTVWAYRTDAYDVAFGPGRGRVKVAGNGNTDLDCVAFDDGGTPIDYDDRPGDTCFMSFDLLRPTMIHVEVQNPHARSNQYIIVVD